MRLVLPLAGRAFAQTIEARDAGEYFGQTVTVVGRASVERMASGEIYLDLDGRRDDAPISGYVSRTDAGPFWGIDRLNGKLVAMHGEIGGFRGRPEIVISTPGQIATVVAPAAKVDGAVQPLWIHIPARW